MVPSSHVFPKTEKVRIEEHKGFCGGNNINIHKRTYKLYILCKLYRLYRLYILYKLYILERSGSVVECLTRDREVAGSSLAGIRALCP